MQKGQTQVNFRNLSPVPPWWHRDFWTHVGLGLWRSVRTKLSEWGLALMMINWGWTVLDYDQPFRFFQAPYDGWGSVIEPSTLGALMISVGSLRLLTLIINGSYSRSPHIRTGFSLISGMVWFFLWISFLQSISTPTAPVVYKWLSIMEFAALIRSAYDARVEDEKHSGAN